MEPVTEEQERPTLPNGSFTQAEEEPPVREDYEAMVHGNDEAIVDPGTPDSTEERTMGPEDLYLY